MDAAVRSIALPGRARLEYAERGEPGGTPLIALHGVTDSRRSFDRLLPHLPASIRAFAISQRGHGDSERPQCGYAPRDFAGDVAAFMDALELDGAVVVGHSMGSVNALRFAVDHPGRLRGLVLLGASAAFGSNPDVVSFWRNQIASLADPIPRAVARDFQLGTVAKPVPQDFIEMAIDESLKAPAHVWRACFDGFMTADLRAALPRIDVPVLVIWGRHDAICNSAAQQALLSMPTTRFHVYGDCAHAPHWEEPQRCARDIRAFVRALMPSRVAA